MPSPGTSFLKISDERGIRNDEQNSSFSVPNSALVVEVEFKSGGEELTREVRITALEIVG